MHACMCTACLYRWASLYWPSLTSICSALWLCFRRKLRTTVCPMMSVYVYLPRQRVVIDEQIFLMLCVLSNKIGWLYRGIFVSPTTYSCSPSRALYSTRAAAAVSGSLGRQAGGSYMHYKYKHNTKTVHTNILAIRCCCYFCGRCRRHVCHCCCYCSGLSVRPSVQFVVEPKLIGVAAVVDLLLLFVCLLIAIACAL